MLAAVVSILTMTSHLLIPIKWIIRRFNRDSDWLWVKPRKTVRDVMIYYANGAQKYCISRFGIHIFMKEAVIKINFEHIVTYGTAIGGLAGRKLLTTFDREFTENELLGTHKRKNIKKYSGITYHLTSEGEKCTEKLKGKKNLPNGKVVDMTKLPTVERAFIERLSRMI